MTATDNLESKCRRLVERETNDAGPTGQVAREIALTLDQIDAVRNEGTRLDDRLIEREMDLKTRILNLKTPPLEYDWDRWAKRKQMTHQLETSLVRLEQQVQRLSLDREQRLHRLQDRLMELWNRREQVLID